MSRPKWATIAIAGAGGLALLGAVWTLRMMSSQSEELATQVGNLGQTAAEMEAALELVRKSQAGRVWVTSGVTQSFAIIRVLNPGHKTVTLKIHTLKSDGTQKFLPTTHTISAGHYIVKEFLETHSGTVVLVSDHPVFPFARNREHDGEVKSEMPILFYPVDCADPKGVEWVCDHVP